MNAIRIGHLGDCEAIVALLEHYGLPVADLDPEPAPGIVFLVLDDPRTGTLVGCVGLEHRCGEAALLRSFAVAPRRPRQGFGLQLLHAAYVLARQIGVRQLYLLTTTASAYFARQGYQVVSRHRVPESIQRSAEFSSLCPASAVAMTSTP
jgi:amino-acid N-acetyltransferase